MIYQIAREQSQLGGFSVVELRNGLDSGKFLHSDMAWKAGMPTWKSLAELLDLAPKEVHAPDEIPALPLPVISQISMSVQKSGRAITALISGLVAVVSLGGGLLISVFMFKQEEPASPVAVGIVMLIALLISGTAILTAIICGHVSLSEIRRFQGFKSGRGMAMAGLWLGYLMILVIGGLFFTMMLGS